MITFQHLPDQKSVDKLLLLLQISRPVSLDVSVELILQSVAVVFKVQFTNLKKKQSVPSVNKQKGEEGEDAEEKEAGRGRRNVKPR